MAERIRLGNVYEHDEYGTVLTVHRDHENRVWFRPVKSQDNAGVISTGEGIESESYKNFLGRVSMRDYPEDWDRKASAIKKRDNETCQACGRVSARNEDWPEAPDWQDEPAELHVHHIVPLGAGGSNARSNLITLCDECHGRVHGGVT